MNDIPPWQSVAEPWRLAFELAWETYLEGSNPIAAVIVDKNSNVVATGKSAVRANVSKVVINRCEIAHDGFGGSVNLLGSTPYLSRKTRHVEGPVPGLDEVSIFLNVYYNVRYATDAEAVHEAFAQDYPDAVNAARKLGEGDRLNFDEKPDTQFMFERVRQALSSG